MPLRCESLLVWLAIHKCKCQADVPSLGVPDARGLLLDIPVRCCETRDSRSAAVQDHSGRRCSAPWGCICFYHEVPLCDAQGFVIVLSCLIYPPDQLLLDAHTCAS